MPPSRRHSPFHGLHHASLHVLMAAIVAVSVGLLFPRGLDWSARVAAAWNAGALTWTALGWWIIGHADADETRRRAAAEDPGRTVVWALMLLASAFSLFATGFVLRHASHGGVEARRLVLGLCLGAIVTAWAATHTAYALRYAHLHYRESGGTGAPGISFPGQLPPTYLDFAYFAFTIGMCFQVSDVSVTTRELRRAVLAHAVLSFSYNTVILAVAINLVVGAMG